MDPIGLVTVRDRAYLLATRPGAGRTYRLSRVSAAEELAEAAQRPSRVDLDRIWRERSAQFLSGSDHLAVLVRVSPARREDLLDSALAVRAEEPEPDGWLRLEVTFQDSRHARWALWRLGTDADALVPRSVITHLPARPSGRDRKPVRRRGLSVGRAATGNLPSPPLPSPPAADRVHAFSVITDGRRRRGNSSRRSTRRSTG